MNEYRKTIEVKPEVKSEYQSCKESSNRDFRDQFGSVAEYKAAVARLPKVPSLVPKRNAPNQRHGLNKAPGYSSFRRDQPRRSRAGYNLGKYTSTNHNFSLNRLI